ncbi:hypothetical protein FI667_g11314, partial [Globisporangium splendens]
MVEDLDDGALNLLHTNFKSPRVTRETAVQPLHRLATFQIPTTQQEQVIKQSMASGLSCGDGEGVEIPTWAQYKKKRGRSARVASYERFRKQVAVHDEEVRHKRAEEFAVASLVDGFRPHVPPPPSVSSNGNDGRSAQSSPPTKKRRVWSNGENNDRMQRALAIWRHLKARDASLSMRKFAKECAIPISSFQRSLKVGGAIAAPGKAPTLSAACEARLKAFVLYRVAFGFGVNWVQVRALALAMAHQLGIKSFKASNGWLEGFKERHKTEIHRHAAQMLDRQRHKKDAMDAAAVSHNFHMLANAYLHTLDSLSLCFSDLKQKEEHINAHIKPWRVWNLSEASFSTDDEQATRKSAEAHVEKVVSTVHCVNAQGDSLPLLFIVSTKKSTATRNNRSALSKVNDPNVQCCTSPSGRLTEDMWVTNAAPMMRNRLCELRRRSGESDDVWYVLVVDEHARVLIDSYGALLDFFENKILVVSMPSSPPANVQPVDVALYESFHAEYQKLLGQQTCTSGTKMTIDQVAALVYRAWQAVGLDKARFVKAFEACGIFPLNLNWSAVLLQPAVPSSPGATIAMETSSISGNDCDVAVTITSSPRSQQCEEQDAAVDVSRQALVNAQNHENFDQAVASFAHTIGLSRDVVARVVSIGMDALINSDGATSSEQSINV